MTHARCTDGADPLGDECPECEVRDHPLETLIAANVAGELDYCAEVLAPTHPLTAARLHKIATGIRRAMA